MGRLIAIRFLTLDGLIEDPDGSDHTSFGGRAGQRATETRQER